MQIKWLLLKVTIIAFVNDLLLFTEVAYLLQNLSLVGTFSAVAVATALPWEQTKQC